ncbi:enoyl-CoA hydratase-related protein [Thiobacillus sp.]|uniref:enoyl-CoA hydratase-related protein n=1 Tax=Thiobacillus sp. TaxID=924 RepID=UPI0011DC0482|nr:enoyl-CoA hydratase-related protein [Thiobacillus sp.]TXH76864.1 MAG: hydrogenase maturation protein [Thiobacillus sp.]
MRILLLTHAFNSLTQRLYVELTALGHQVSVEFDINDRVTEEAVALFRPHLILGSFLKRAIPESIWRTQVCLILHPGIVGDRGPSALDWAILNGETEWGVTLLQAEAEMDAGPIWATQTFPMRSARKSSLYRNEVTEAAVQVVRSAIERWPEYLAGHWRPQPLRPHDPAVRGRFRPAMTQRDRAIDWAKDDTATVLAKLNSADGAPGVLDELFGQPCYLYDAHAVPGWPPPGAQLGRSGDDGVVRACRDGAVKIGHVRHKEGAPSIKLPVALSFPEVALLPEWSGGGDEIRYEEVEGVGYLYFDFYNGVMGSEACQRLLATYEAARQRPTRVIVLMGGADFFSNGLDLNRIEAAASPPDESWRNINAMDDLCRAILTTGSHLTVSALRGNAGAGGAYLALAADRVWARRGVILNPHYKNMGNLYGSEYWSYLLPKRVGAEQVSALLRGRLPLGADQAAALGFVDEVFGDDPAGFEAETRRRTAALAESPDFADLLREKNRRRAADEAAKSLEAYRAEELEHMQRNFYGFDPSYHVARHHFVHKTPHSWTPRHLARHRELGWVVPVEEMA